VDAARNVHTAESKHVQKSGEGNSLPEINAVTRLLIEQNRDSPSLSGIPGARHAETVIGIYCRLVHTFCGQWFQKDNLHCEILNRRYQQITVDLL